MHLYPTWPLTPLFPWTSAPSPCKVMFALKTDSYVVPSVFRKKPKFLRFNTMLIGKPFKFSDLEEFQDVKINHDVLDRASEVLSEKLKFLKEVDLKEFKKSLKIKKTQE
jgi:hypothetical protein